MRYQLDCSNQVDSGAYIIHLTKAMRKFYHMHEQMSTSTSMIIIPERPFNGPFVGEFSDEVIRYQHPHDGPNEFWYDCASRKRLVYLWFERPCRSQDTIRDAMRYALNKGLDGVKVTETHWKTE